MNYFAVFIAGLLCLLGALIGLGIMAGISGQWIAIVCLAVVGVSVIVAAMKFHKSDNQTPNH